MNSIIFTTLVELLQDYGGELPNIRNYEQLYHKLMKMLDQAPETNIIPKLFIRDFNIMHCYTYSTYIHSILLLVILIEM